ncbi:MAG TPA: geranylgeranylglycerol-phosphate geranylgeranyltransferase [Chitinophagales bacterium]|nr:geranylgeranylglycerol-phosphate geranylgeranyltransferase [Chitinophagales bacterium]
MEKVIALARLVRAGNLFIIALSISLFYYLILVPAHQFRLFTNLVPFTNFEFVLFVLSVILIAAAGNIINDYFDFELDKEFKPERPLAQGMFSLDTAMYLHAALAFAGIGIGFYLGYRADSFKIGYIYVICTIMLYVYSAFLKKVALAGNVLVSALTGFVFVLLMLFELRFLNTLHFENAGYVLDLLLWQVKFYGGFAFLTNLAREIVKDIEDREGDEEHNILTLPVQFGVPVAKIAVGIVFALLLAGLAFFMRGFIAAGATKEFIYLTVAVVIPVLAAGVMLAMAKEKKQYAAISLLLKVIMLLGILSIPAFYLFNKQ